MNNLIKMLVDDDGIEVDIDQQHWHYVDYVAGGNATLCTGEYFGRGESTSKYETKSVQKGGITCPQCIGRIKEIKAIKQPPHLNQCVKCTISIQFRYNHFSH